MATVLLASVALELTPLRPRDPSVPLRPRAAYVTRRAALTTTFLAVPLRPAIAASPAASPESGKIIPPGVRVATWPSIEYLEPIYELKLSLDALQPAVADRAKWPALRKRLGSFFGGPLSEQYYYPGLALQYASRIVYADLDEFDRVDKTERQQRITEVVYSPRVPHYTSPNPAACAILSCTPRSPNPPSCDRPSPHSNG